MKQLVIDIETVGVDFESLDKKRKEYLLKYCDDEEEIFRTKNSLGLYPLTGEIVAIGMLNPESLKGKVFFQSGADRLDDFEEEGAVFSTGSEEEIISRFWETVCQYDRIITFNGRGFDIPFLMLRSAILGVQPTRNFLGNRYNPGSHCDLLEQLTFYGLVRKYNLDFYAKAFSIKSSKDSGIDGSKVGDLYKNGEYAKIARYCFQDLVTTKELFEKWDQYLDV